MYLPEGEFAGSHTPSEKEAVRNAPLTNRVCERNSGILDKVWHKPNPTPNYIQASLLLQRNDLDLSHMGEEKAKALALARKCATEDIAKNKRYLKQYVKVQQVLLQQKVEAKQDKGTMKIAVWSRSCSKITKFGGEWKNKSQMEDALK